MKFTLEAEANIQAGLLIVESVDSTRVCAFHNAIIAYILGFSSSFLDQHLSDSNVKLVWC